MVNCILAMVAKPSKIQNTTNSFIAWLCSSLLYGLYYHNDNTLLNGQLTTKMKIEPLSSGFKQKPIPYAQAHCEVEEVVVENDTNTSEVTTTILGTTITLIAIGIYQLKIMLYLPFQLQIKVKVN